MIHVIELLVRKDYLSGRVPKELYSAVQCSTEYLVRNVPY